MNYIESNRGGGCGFLFPRKDRYAGVDANTIFPFVHVSVNLDHCGSGIMLVDCPISEACIQAETIGSPNEHSLSSSILANRPALSASATAQGYIDSNIFSRNSLTTSFLHIRWMLFVLHMLDAVY